MSLYTYREQVEEVRIKKKERLLQLLMHLISRFIIVKHGATLYL